MARATLYFPRGFLWGTATAAHQVEGNNRENNWWAWEQEPGRILKGHRSGLACDWWGGRWREDFDRAREDGQNAHRLSVEWSRVQPRPERWDEDALDHYREMIRGLHERGMTPMVTLHHFTDPLWVGELGGWENPDIVPLFAIYVAKVVEALKEYVTLWCTVNEPNVLAYSAYLAGLFPPGKKSLAATFRVLENLARAHVAAYHEIHRVQREARAGMAVHYRSLIPARGWNPLDRWAAGIQAHLFNDFFPNAALYGWLGFPGYRRRLPEARKTQDFLGINYYTEERVSFSPTAAAEMFGRRSFPPEAPQSETNFIAHVPDGLFRALSWGRRYGAPIIVTENGVDDRGDRLRPRYLAEHLGQVWRAVNFNWPVKGYFHWTLVDNFEWDRGWTQRFGLWELDPATQARIRRPSADLYAAICRSNSIESEVVADHAPAAYQNMFPG